MRLNWNNLGRGLEAIAGAKKAQDLAQASARYDVTEGAYGPGLQENITQLEGLKAQDPAQAAAYDQAIGELTRRQGLTAPDYSVASGPTNFATRQEARQAAAPMRAEGLAGVYRQYGDVAQADALETRAYEQQRALAAEARAVAAEGRNIQDFSNRQTIAGLDINERTQKAADAQKMTDFNAWQAQNPQAGFAEINAEVQRLGMGVDQQFKIASNLTGIGEQEFKASQQRIRKVTENQGLDGLLKAHKESNDLDPGSHFEVIRGKGGALSLNRVDTATGKVIQPNVFSGSEAETTAYLNKAAMDPATIIDFTMNLAKNKSGLAKDAAAIRASDATANLSATRAKGLARDAATLAKLDAIDQQIEAIPPGEMNGPVARGLLMQRNAIVAGTTKQVTPGAAPRPEVTAAAVVEYAKGLVGKPSGEMKDGKPVRYNAETAAVAARRALSTQDGAAAPADPADALIAAMRQNAPAAPRATPAGQSLINLSNTMLPPAAPVQTAPTTRQEQLRGLYLGQPRQQ